MHITDTNPQTARREVCLLKKGVQHARAQVEASEGHDLIQVYAHKHDN